MSLVAVAVALALFAVPAQDGQKKVFQYPMVTLQFGFFTKGAHRSAPEDAEKNQKGHIANLERMYKEGKGLMAGPLGDKGDIRGIVVLDVKAEDTMKEFENDPYVKNGILKIEFHPWMTVREFIRKANEPFEMGQYTLGLLRKGPKEAKKEDAKLQTGHLDNIDKMWKAGDLALVGPFLDKGDIRGIFIFRTTDEKKIRELVSNDPAIKAETLVLELHPLYMAKGVIGDPPKAGG